MNVVFATPIWILIAATLFIVIMASLCSSSHGRKVLSIAVTLTVLIAGMLAIIFGYSAQRSERHTVTELMHEDLARSHFHQSVVEAAPAASQSRSGHDLETVESDRAEGGNAISVEMAETDRPDWVQDEGWRRIQDGRKEIWQSVIEVGPESDGFELEKGIDRAIADSLNVYLREKVARDAAAVAPIRLGEAKEWRTRLVKAQHEDHHKRRPSLSEPNEVVTVRHVWLRLELDPASQRELRHRYEQELVSQRLWYVGGGAAVVATLLSVVFGTLKVDTATRGFYTGRLLFTAALAILGILALGLMIIAPIP